ncbi:MAG: hypothetical protein HBSAPP03_03820 [Phycisphaerae bacterium]|nr:MAG: hypothetical protein HBSAPP03_03820 [Phycisphaerae bacterium]
MRGVRLKVVVLTLLVAIPACVAIWWHSPGGVQWRRMREAQAWLDWATPALREDPRLTELEYLVSTSEQIWVRGTVEAPSDLSYLAGLIENLGPPCPVRLLEVTGRDGEILEPTAYPEFFRGK